MKLVKILLGALLVLGAVLAVVAPVGPLPGFLIGGTPTPVPERWADTSEVHEIRLSVPGTLPRVVIIWVVEYADDLYVVGSSDSGWVKRIGEGAPVEMRLADATYALRATRVNEGMAPILEAYVAKYQPDYPDIVAGFPKLEDAEGKFGVFRLDAG